MHCIQCTGKSWIRLLSIAWVIDWIMEQWTSSRKNWKRQWVLQDFCALILFTNYKNELRELFEYYQSGGLDTVQEIELGKNYRPSNLSFIIIFLMIHFQNITSSAKNNCTILSWKVMLLCSLVIEGPGSSLWTSGVTGQTFRKAG
jgi:hypothetical protein